MPYQMENGPLGSGTKQTQCGCPRFRGAWRRPLPSLGIPGDCEKLQLPLMESRGPMRNPPGSTPLTGGEDRVGSQLVCHLAAEKGHFWTIPPVSPLTEKLAYWDPNLGCLLRFLKPLVSLSWLVSPCAWGHTPGFGLG